MPKQKLIDHIYEQLRLHGLSFVMLAAITYYFYTKVEALSNEVKDCNAAVIRVYEEDRKKLIETIERNTVALNKIRKQNE